MVVFDLEFISVEDLQQDRILKEMEFLLVFCQPKFSHQWNKDYHDHHITH